MTKYSYSVTYHHPVTTVRFSGTTTVTVDHLREEPEMSAETVADAGLITLADTRGARTAKVETGWFSDVNVSLSLTDDQRLTAASSDSTGQLGAVATQLLGAAATAGGLLLAAGLARPPGDVPGWVAERATKAKERRDYAEEKYAEEHEDAAKLRKRYQTLIGSIAAEIADLTGQLVKADTATPATASRLAMLRSARANAEAELTRLDALFNAWQAALRTSYKSDRTIDIEMDRLPGHRTVTFDVDASDLRVHELTGTIEADLTDERVKLAWDVLGLLVTCDPVPAVPAGSGTATDGVAIREPRQVHWRLWARKHPEHSANREVRLVREGTAPVVDAASTEAWIQFRRSLWARRSVKAALSDAGILKELDVTATSSAAAVASVLGGVPTAVGGGLTQANTLLTSYHSLQDASSDRALAQAKRQLDEKQTELTLSGLNATSSQYDELLQLQQQVAITGAQASLDPATLQAQAIQRDVSVLNAQRDDAVASRELRTETELSGLRQQVDALTVAWRRDNPGG